MSRVRVPGPRTGEHDADTQPLSLDRIASAAALARPEPRPPRLTIRGCLVATVVLGLAFWGLIFALIRALWP